MAEEDIEKIKKLSPKERIAKLKELQEKDKTEIAEAQRLIRESEEQLAVEEEIKEVPIPQVKVVDLDELFSAEEKELFKAKRFVEEKTLSAEEEAVAAERETALEEAVAAESPHPTEDGLGVQRQYRIRIEEMARRPADELYNRMRDIYQQFQESGALTPEQMREVGDIQYAQIRKMDDIRQGGYLPSEQAVREMVLTQRMANKLKEMYRA